MKKIIFPTVLILFFGGLFGLWKFYNDFAYGAASDSEEEIVYEVRPGQTLTEVVKDLERQELIRDATMFLILAKIKGDSNRMKVGEYLFMKNMTPMDVLATLTSGRSVGRKFTVSEGLNIFEISELYEKQGFGAKKEFWKLVNDPEFATELLGERQQGLEGYLYPETYQITKYTDTRSVIRAMVARFMDVYRREIEPLLEGSQFSRHQMVTLASIIEKETGAPEERETISSVFHNRLRIGMPLQTDPTVLYGKAKKLGKFEISITRADLLAPTEYNTYVIKSLPPGPVANPGKLAMLAALQPAKTEYLFFVSQNDGTHVFSKKYQDHHKAVQRFQMDAKAREGRSWRELSKQRAGENLQQKKTTRQ